MVNCYRKNYIELDKYVEEHYEHESVDYNRLKGILNVVDSEIKAVEQGTVPANEMDRYICSIRGTLRLVHKRIKGGEIDETANE